MLRVVNNELYKQELDRVLYFMSKTSLVKYMTKVQIIFILCSAPSRLLVFTICRYIFVPKYAACSPKPIPFSHNTASGFRLFRQLQILQNGMTIEGQSSIRIYALTRILQTF